MNTAFLALGSNVGDREAHLRSAVKHLESSEIQVLRRSPFYQTEPQELLDQPWFLNAVVGVKTALLPLQLLARISDIEHEMGRQRAIPKGPRNIDIDILFYGSLVISTDQIELPHPRLAQRRFVLEPLAEIAPDFRHPLTGQTASEMLKAVAPQSVQRLKITW